MIKKTPVLVAFLLLVSLPAGLAGVDGHTDQGVGAREGMVIGRGLGNIMTLPFEIVSTLKSENEMHPKVWPITFIPRVVTNIIVRAVSAVNDIVFYPWIVPFTDDISPMTESFGLPDYPTQSN
ncbi:MAG: hypothetical protein HYZ84_02220 [Candidatus Omnitrophica bacterium]|nr:hypothetical protein [Candidatus Omnitrophota bacterium]